MAYNLTFMKKPTLLYLTLALVGILHSCFGGSRGTGTPDQNITENASRLNSAVITTKGRFILDPSGERLVMRGVNEMFIWSPDFTGEELLPEIAKTGANTTRLVWLTDSSSTRATAANLDLLLQNCIDQGMFPMPELHDATGDWDKLPAMVDYWVRPDVLQVLKKHEAYLLLNIANECGGHEVSTEAFTAGYLKAVERLREAGLRCPLVIDAAGWGQNLEQLLEAAPVLLEADPLKNLIFSVHMWWPAEDGSTLRIEQGLERAVELNLPLIVGEFAPMGVGCKRFIDYHSIMARCQELQIGWLSWSWGAVPNGDCSEMDMTREPKRGRFEGLTDWGLEVAVSHPQGIAASTVKSDFLKKMQKEQRP